MTDLIKLRELAEKATKLPWVIAPRTRSSCFVVQASPTMKIVQTFGDSLGAEQDSAFIAAANPATIIALIDALEAAEKRVAKLESALKLNDELLLMNAR